MLLLSRILPASMISGPRAGQSPGLPAPAPWSPMADTHARSPASPPTRRDRRGQRAGAARATTTLKRDAVDPRRGAGLQRARLPQHLARRHRRRARRHQAHGLLLRREQGAAAVRVLPRRPRADPRGAASQPSVGSPGSGETAARGHARLRRRDRLRVRLVHGARRATRTSAPELEPRRSTRSSPRSTRASAACCARAWRTARSAVRPEARGVRDRRRAQLDRALVSRRTSRSTPAEVADAFVTFFEHGLLPRPRRAPWQARG